MTLSFIGMRSNTNSCTLKCNNLILHSGVSFLFPIQLENVCVRVWVWEREILNRGWSLNYPGTFKVPLCRMENVHILNWSWCHVAAFYFSDGILFHQLCHFIFADTSLQIPVNIVEPENWIASGHLGFFQLAVRSWNCSSSKLIPHLTSVISALNAYDVSLHNVHLFLRRWWKRPMKITVLFFLCFKSQRDNALMNKFWRNTSPH